jgi:hypothetical protein
MFFPLNGPNGKANVWNSLIHILNCCIFCCYIMTSMWWTFSCKREHIYTAVISEMNDNNIKTTSCKREHIYIAAINERNDNNIRTTSCKQRTYMQDSQMCSVPQTCPIPQACSITSSSHKCVLFAILTGPHFGFSAL